jgi:predicted RNA-binding protein (virulence factor B family)
MQFGKTQTLKISDKNNSGWILTDESGEKAFLPKIFIQDDKEIDDEIEVLYIRMMEN